MKFAKQNLVVLICAAVAVLLVVAAFVWPVPGWFTETKDAMNQRLAVRSVVKQLTQTSLNLPGLPEKKGVPSPAYIGAKKDAISAIDNAMKAVEKAGQVANAKGRVNNANVPLLPVPGKGAGIVEAGYLPKLRSDPMKYKADYNSQFRLWTGWLATGVATDSELDAAMPSDPSQVKNEYDEQQRARATNTGMGAVVGAPDATELNNYVKRRVMNKAAELRMYVDRSAFQMRGWAQTDSTPDETQIFESLVDSWFQSDVVKAIAATNLQFNPNPTAADHGSIARSPVKRLTRIVIGVNALHHMLTPTGGTTGMTGAAMGAGQPAVDPGALFLLLSNANNGGGSPAGQILASGGAVATTDDQLPANETHYEVGMSGRSGGRTYDIVMMDIVVDIDPAKLNTFIDELYKQNMGYTVSGVQVHTVDPLDRVSNGYLYGEGQVVEAEIQVEGLLFRSWTRPIMPDGESAILGISPYKATDKGPAPAGNP